MFGKCMNYEKFNLTMVRLCFTQDQLIYVLLYHLILCTQLVWSQCAPNNYANVSATTTYQELTSPGYPSNYPPNLDCLWYIETDNSSYVIRLEFLEFSTEDTGYCSEDKVVIYDGEPYYSNYLETYCGRKIPDPVVSIGVLLTIKLQTDSSKHSTGFKARYIAGPESELYFDDDSSDQITTTDNSVYVILGVTTGTVLLVVIVIAVAINVYKHVQAKKLHDSPQSPSNRRFSDARVHPIVFNGQQFNDNNTNTFNTDCPPVYSEFAPRPMSPPPRYTMFDTNTFR